MSRGDLIMIIGNGVRSFILLSRLPFHQVADGRVMQLEVSGYLLLSITIFVNGINDLRIFVSRDPKSMTLKALIAWLPTGRDPTRHFPGNSFGSYFKSLNSLWNSSDSTRSRCATSRSLSTSSAGILKAVGNLLKRIRSASSFNASNLTSTT